MGQSLTTAPRTIPQSRTLTEKETKKVCEKCTPPFVVGIGGATRAGKSTLAASLCTLFSSPFKALCQDTYFRRDIPRDEYYKFGNWELPASIDFDKFFEALEGKINRATIQCEGCRGEEKLDSEKRHTIFVEGFLLFSDPRIFEYLHKCMFIATSYQISFERRNATKPVPPTYFEKIVWPNYLRYISTQLSQQTISQHKILILDGITDSKEGIQEKAVKHIKSEILNEDWQDFSKILPLITFRKLTIGLTGASSFLGNHILFSLLYLGYNVLAMFNTTSGEVLQSFSNRENLRVFKRDLLIPCSCDDIFEECDYVIHTATTHSMPQDEAMMKNILDSCQRSSLVKKLIFTSTLATRDRLSHAHQSEFHASLLARLAAEELASKFIENQEVKKFDVAVIQAPVVIGSRSPSSHASQRYPKHQDTNNFIKEALVKQSLQSEVAFPFIDVRDLAYAHIAVMKEAQESILVFPEYVT